MLVHERKLDVMITWMTTVFWLIGQQSSAGITDGTYLNDALDYFEVLHRDHIIHHIPPHTSQPFTTRETIHLYFRAFNRDFNLILTPSRKSLHNQLHVSIVTDETVERRHFPFPHFYTGHILGMTDTTTVTGHIHPHTRLLTASIHTADEVYYVEPSYRHFVDKSHDFHMIIYKQSHLKFNSTGQASQHFCGNHSDHISPWKQVLPLSSPYGEEKQRLRRDLAGDVCTLHLVATPSFHSQYSSGDPDMTTLFLINLMYDIDQHIFQDTVFATPHPKLGLVVTNVTIYTTVTDTTPKYARESERDSEALLKLLSLEDWSDVCLVHLFTAERLSDDRLGVAYVASRNRDDIGGICSPRIRGSNGMFETANVGISSFRNSGNRLLLLAEARLVTAHEIGHGWGSEHDPINNYWPWCSPLVEQNQGKYIMFPSATNGDQTNNDRFSPCSIDMISDVVKQKGDCFQERSLLVGQCGDYMIQDGEECDAGALGMVDSDPCCTSDCRLRDTAPGGDPVECSDVNDGCCEDCRVISEDTQRICLTHRPGNAQCLRSVQCMGRKECPQDLPFDLTYVDELTVCGQDGRCLQPGSECTTDGNCTSVIEDKPNRLQCFNFCQWHRLKECYCSGSDECKFCCLQLFPGSTNRTCAPFGNNTRPTRSSCVGGFCENGECIPSSQDLIQRLFVLFDNPNINTFVQFMKENIVGTIVILTALFWIPAAFFIHIYDGYRWREHKRIARELEADREDAELQDEDDLQFYDNVFEEMEQSQPGVLRPEAKYALMRLDSGTIYDYFDNEDTATPLLTPIVPATSHSQDGANPYSGFWEHRLSTITEESQILNPERDNILAHMTPKTGSTVESGHYLKRSSFDVEPGTLV